MATKPNGFNSDGQYYAMGDNNQIGYIEQLQILLIEIKTNANNNLNY